jgi:hypothetical protein
MPKKQIKLNIGKLLGIGCYAVIALACAFIVGRNALANVASSINAQAVHRISPAHPKGNLAKAEALLNTGKKGRELSDAANYAKASLRVQAINPAALHVLGYVNTEKNNSELPKARKIQALAYRTSRRDINVIRWMIADGERRGDLPEILKYYDIGMRLGPDAQQALFPRLNLAMGVTSFHPMFKPYIQNNAPWLANFLGYSVYNSKTSDKLAEAIMLAGGLPKNVKSYRETEGLLLGLLVSQGHFDTSRQYYLSLNDAKPNVLSSLSLTSENVNPLRSAITWQPVSGAAAGGDFLTAPVKNKMILQASVLPSGNGNVATKLLYLTPGTYSFSAKRELQSRGDNALADVKLNCVIKGREQLLWSGDLLRNQGYDKIIVPQGCTSQSFAIWLSGGDSQVGTEILISELAITSS